MTASPTPRLRAVRRAAAFAYRPRLTRFERTLWSLGAALDTLRVPVVRLGRFSA